MTYRPCRGRAKAIYDYIALAPRSLIELTDEFGDSIPPEKAFRIFHTLFSRKRPISSIDRAITSGRRRAIYVSALSLVSRGALIIENGLYRVANREEAE